MRTLRRLWYLDPTATEIWLSVISLAAGFWLLIPFETISVPFSAFQKTFGLLSFEVMVSLWLITLGSVRLYSVVLDKRQWRGVCAVFAFSTWIFLLYISLIIDYRALVTIMYFVPSLMSMWVFLRSTKYKES
jgi:hypothetical protein